MSVSHIIIVNALVYNNNYSNNIIIIYVTSDILVTIKV